jgi:uncharacterized protein (DUF58 family)
MLPLRRGTIHFESIELLCPDPLGLCCARSRERNVAHLTSLPERHPVPKLSWPSERKFHRGGLALTVAVGDSQEFFGLREYRPGDPIKRIHWRSFAKLGVPLIREFQDEYFDRHALIVDTYTGTGDPASFESVVSAAASFVDAGHPSDSLLDLVFVGERVWRLTAGRGLASTRQVLCDLADVEASSTDEFAALAEYLRGYRKQLATVILVSAFWNNLREAFMREFQHLDTRAFAVIVGTQPDSETTTDGSSSRCWVRPDHLAADLAKVNFGRAVT